MAGGGSSRLQSPALAGVIIRTIMKKIRWSAALLAACFLWAQATPPADAQKAANERRDYIKAHYTKHEFPIPMRDGVRLFTSIYAPKNEGEKYPILLNRTPYTVAPYGDDNYRTNLGPSEKFFREGFVFVYQDVPARAVPKAALCMRARTIPIRSRRRISTNRATPTTPSTGW